MLSAHFGMSRLPRNARQQKDVEDIATMEESAKKPNKTRSVIVCFKNDDRLIIDGICKWDLVLSDRYFALRNDKEDLMAINADEVKYLAYYPDTGSEVLKTASHLDSAEPEK